MVAPTSADILSPGRSARSVRDATPARASSKVKPFFADIREMKHYDVKHPGAEVMHNAPMPAWGWGQTGGPYIPRS
jgi:hypothetical protein